MKNVGKSLILMTLFFATMAFTCTKEDENHHSTIRVVNNSDKSIYAYGSHTYPDTFGGMGGGGLSSPYEFKVDPNVENKYALRLGGYYETEFRDWEIPSDTLIVYVFDAELLEAHVTHVQNTVIQRYDLSLQDLQQVNWKLTYPPSPNMRDMKMYPPYGTNED